MCETALAHREAQRRIAAGATAGEILAAYDRAVAAARENQRIYQVNYDDDYDATDGLCARVTDRLEQQRRTFLSAVGGPARPLQAWEFIGAGDLLGWTQAHDLTPPASGAGLETRATGPDPFLVQAAPPAIPVDDRCFLEIEMASDRAGAAQVFYATDGAGFSEARSARFDVAAGEGARHRIAPGWCGTLTGLRLDTPDGAAVRLSAVRILQSPPEKEPTPGDLAREVPDAVRRTADRPLNLPWEKLSDIVPADPVAKKPGRYLSVDLGLDPRPDPFRLGVVFTVQAAVPGGGRGVMFRRAIHRRSRGWEHWDIPLEGIGAGGERGLEVRFMTDSYSRAQDRNAPTWTWAVWGQPRLVDVAADGERRVRYDFVERIAEGRASVRLDADGRERPFDGAGEDATGATFRRADAAGTPEPVGPAIAAFTPHRNGAFGVTIAGFRIPPDGPR